MAATIAKTTTPECHATLAKDGAHADACTFGVREGQMFTPDEIYALYERVQDTNTANIKFRAPMRPRSFKYVIQCVHSKSKGCPYRLSFTPRSRADASQWCLTHIHLTHDNHLAYTEDDRHISQRKQGLIDRIEEIEGVYVTLSAKARDWAKPRTVLAAVRRELQLNIYDGVQSREHRRQIKKKFDNILRDVRKRHQFAVPNALRGGREGDAAAAHTPDADSRTITSTAASDRQHFEYACLEYAHLEYTHASAGAPLSASNCIEDIDKFIGSLMPEFRPANE